MSQYNVSFLIGVLTMQEKKHELALRPLFPNNANNYRCVGM